MTDEDILKCVGLFSLRMTCDCETRSKKHLFKLDKVHLIQFARCLLKYQHIENPDPIKDFIKLLDEQHPNPMSELISDPKSSSL